MRNKTKLKILHFGKKGVRVSEEIILSFVFLLLEYPGLIDAWYRL